MLPDVRKPPRRKTLGWAVIDWIEDHLCHGPGDIQGTPFADVPLTDEQCLFILWAYALRPDGRRLIRRAFLSRSKGWAKSEFAGAIVMAEALGPVRFDRWSNRQPVGRRVTSPEILCVATEEGQAGNTYDNVVVMGEHLLEHHGDEFKGLDVGLTRTFLPGGGEISPVSAKARSKDGGRSTFVVFDETHLYEIQELRDLHATIRRNLGKRAAAEPWSLETSTMYAPGVNSVAEATHDYAKAIENGSIKDASLLFDHRQGNTEFDWDDDDQLRKALEEAYGDSGVFQDWDRKIAEIRDPQAEEADSRRFWLNQVVQATEQAFDLERWKTLADPKHVIADETLVVLGFAGGRLHDSTALIGTEVQTGHQFVVDVWERPNDADEDWEVDEDAVDQAVSAAFDRLDVWRLYGNPSYWESAMDRWSGRWEKRVVRWWINRNKPMAYALRSFLTGIRTGELSHDADSVMQRHIAAARKRIVPRLRDEDGKSLWVLTKEHGTVINAAVAAVLSWEARGDAVAAGAKPSRRSGKAVFL